MSDGQIATLGLHTRSGCGMIGVKRKQNIELRKQANREPNVSGFCSKMVFVPNLAIIIFMTEEK